MVKVQRKQVKRETGELSKGEFHYAQVNPRKCIRQTVIRPAICKHCVYYTHPDMQYSYAQADISILDTYLVLSVLLFCV